MELTKSTMVETECIVAKCYVVRGKEDDQKKMTVSRLLSEQHGVLQARKAQLIQLAFERDLTRKLRDEWKDLVLRKFSASSRRLQLF